MLLRNIKGGDGKGIIHNLIVRGPSTHLRQLLMYQVFIHLAEMYGVVPFDWQGGPEEYVDHLEFKRGRALDMPNFIDKNEDGVLSSDEGNQTRRVLWVSG